MFRKHDVIKGFFYGNLNRIQANYCADAISIIRETTGIPAVMVASFNSYEKALAFARLVGGEVGEPTND